MPKTEQPQQLERTVWCGAFPRLSIHDPEHCAHWKVFDRGHAHADLTLYGKGHGVGCLSMDVSEYTEGAKSSKRTMLTLDEGATRALYDMLRERYGDKT